MGGSRLRRVLALASIACLLRVSLRLPKISLRCPPTCGPFLCLQLYMLSTCTSQYMLAELAYMDVAMSDGELNSCLGRYLLRRTCLGTLPTSGALLWCTIIQPAALSRPGPGFHSLLDAEHCLHGCQVPLWQPNERLHTSVSTTTGIPHPPTAR